MHTRLTSVFLSITAATTHFTQITLVMIAFLYSTPIAQAFYIGSVEVQVVDTNDVQLPTYHHHGEHYIMGRYNQRYMLRVVNHSNQRFELVMTVDGRDVINGELGSFTHRGYVVDPYQQFNVEGFRRSTTEVAAFRFTHPSDSYASRRGSGQNIGVIGVALFSERNTHRRTRHYDFDEHEHSLSDVTPSSRMPKSEMQGSSIQGTLGRRPKKKSRYAQQNEIGTRYGETLKSQTEQTRFIRASSSPNQLLVVNYDSEAGLRRRGIITLRPNHQHPHAFPRESGFAPPP